MSGRAAIRRNGTTPAWADEEVVTQRTERDATTEDVPAPPPVDEGGAVTVSARVVADIVARAVGEVRGVHGLVPRGEDPLLAWLRRLAGRDGDVPGVAVRVGGREVRVGLAVAVAYGTSIPVVVDALRRY